MGNAYYHLVKFVFPSICKHKSYNRQSCNFAVFYTGVKLDHLSYRVTTSLSFHRTVPKMPLKSHVLNWIEKSCDQPNKLFHHKTNMATLFSCHTEGTKDHYLHIENYLKKEPICSVCKDMVVVLNLKTSIKLDELYANICTYKKTCTVPEWQIHPRKYFLLVTNGAHSSGGRDGHQDVAKLLSFVLSNPMLEQVFSIMNCYWRNEHN